MADDNCDNSDNSDIMNPDNLERVESEVGWIYQKGQDRAAATAGCSDSAQRLDDHRDAINEMRELLERLSTDQGILAKTVRHLQSDGQAGAKPDNHHLHQHYRKKIEDLEEAVRTYARGDDFSRELERDMDHLLQWVQDNAKSWRFNPDELAALERARTRREMRRTIIHENV